MPLLFPAGSGEGHRIQRSLRFNSADFAYLVRTPGGSTNRDVLTFHCWLKRSALGVIQYVLEAVIDANNRTSFSFNATDQFRIRGLVAGAAVLTRFSSRVFRDPSAWFSITVQINTNTSTYRVWVDADELTAWDTDAVPAAGTDTAFNHTCAHYLGAGGSSGSATDLFNGYLTHVHLIDGLALDYSAFLAQDGTTSVWGPKAYTGAYGTNGFKLDFADNSAVTAATLGKDTSGNGNNYTPNNLSVTAGVGNDSLVDTPTSYGVDSGAGGEVRGNYGVLSSIDISASSNAALSNGALTLTGTGALWGVSRGTMFVSSGKWYFEGTATNAVGGMALGIISPASTLAASAASNYVGKFSDSYGYHSGGFKYNNAVQTVYGATYTTGNVIGVALDLDAGTITCYKNGVSQGVMYSSLAGSFAPAASVLTVNAQWNMNFGQRPFAYAAPANHKALCTQNLPTPAIKRGDDFMTVNTRTGTGAAFNVTGKRFAPDLVWMKNRTTALNSHLWFDTSRGVLKHLSSDQTAVELTTAGTVTAFNADGYSGDSHAYVGATGAGYVDWMWKEGVVPGFDIVLYSGTGAVQNVAHGLGVAPAFMIMKSRSSVNAWIIYHGSLGAGFYLIFDTAAASAGGATAWNSTAPTSAQFTLGPTPNGANVVGGSHVAYLFADVPGFSKFGSYTGNGSADGSFVWTGFRPRWVMIKCSDAVTSWVVLDTTRESVNPASLQLYPNLSNTEASTVTLDFLSNGFKIRSILTGTWIYAAFAEHPFKYARAR